MIKELTKALTKNKNAVVIAVAVMVVLAYAVPFGADLEAVKGVNQGKHYGVTTAGDGYGVFCDHHKIGKGPDPCRP